MDNFLVEMLEQELLVEKARLADMLLDTKLTPEQLEIVADWCRE